MVANVIDGKKFAQNMRNKIAADVKELKAKHHVTPELAVVLVGENPASEVYVKSKERYCSEVGINSCTHRVDEESAGETLFALLEVLNADLDVHGILVQLPLPSYLDEALVIRAISPQKDVDGFHISNVGLLGTGQKSLVPCTPLGCLLLLQDQYDDLSGLNVVVVGRSNIVGKPMAQLLLQENCTVTIAHSRSRDIQEITRQADIVVAAVGRPQFIKGDWIKEGATIIDVGINRIACSDGTTRLVGDVDFESVKNIAGAVTPVPGGVGPMTIACLLSNVLTTCCRMKGIEEPTGFFE
ncbi:MAG: bifunctional methylenetetrahydrofolate dehydrogenase/methenyltetrahydrofolate cyclohydrolase FolD [Aestuariivita sp.]|nr:bifunctional methylenetetrahydrofolate dehydrogenase/methenyltetrahydrofolate cyclohydrolase FolD [Aestuariivita sp.]